MTLEINVVVNRWVGFLLKDSIPCLCASQGYWVGSVGQNPNVQGHSLGFDPHNPYSIPGSIGLPGSLVPAAGFEVRPDPLACSLCELRKLPSTRVYNGLYFLLGLFWYWHYTIQVLVHKQTDEHLNKQRIINADHQSKTVWAMQYISIMISHSLT